MTELLDIITLATITGFVGDALLQIFTKYLHLGGTTGWGLLPYFSQHGSVESTFIAGGMMAIFYIAYIKLLLLPLRLDFLALYGIILDLMFREWCIFPSLDGYYKALNYFWSAFWGAIPMVIPLMISHMIF